MTIFSVNLEIYEQSAEYINQIAFLFSHAFLCHMLRFMLLFFHSSFLYFVHIFMLSTVHIRLMVLVLTWSRSNFINIFLIIFISFASNIVLVLFVTGLVSTEQVMAGLTTNLQVPNFVSILWYLFPQILLLRHPPIFSGFVRCSFTSSTLLYPYSQFLNIQFSWLVYL